jgi:hypothetical protein
VAPLALGPFHVLPGEPSQVPVSDARGGQMAQPNEPRIVVCGALAEEGLPSICVRLADARGNLCGGGGATGRLQLLLQSGQHAAAGPSDDSNEGMGGDEERMREVVVEELVAMPGAGAEFSAAGLQELLGRLEAAPAASASGHFRLLLKDAGEADLALPDFLVGRRGGGGAGRGGGAGKERAQLGSPEGSPVQQPISLLPTRQPASLRTPAPQPPLRPIAHARCLPPSRGNQHAYGQPVALLRGAAPSHSSPSPPAASLPGRALLSLSPRPTQLA